MIQRTWWPRINRNAQLAKGLVFAGLGGGASTLQYADASGYNNHGTLTQMDPATDWVFDPTLGRFCTDHDGTNDYISFGTLRFQVSDGNPWTLSAWIKAAAGIAQYDTAFGNCDGGGVGWRLWTRDTSSHKWYWETYGTSNNVVSSAAIDLGTWHHIVCLVEPSGFSKGNISLYIDNVLQNTKSGASLATANDYFLIGSHLTDSRFFPMQICDILVYRRMLDSSERSRLADPSNVCLSGLILPPRRVVFPAAVAGGDKTVSISSPLDVTVSLEGFPIAVNRTIQITG